MTTETRAAAKGDPDVASPSLPEPLPLPSHVRQPSGATTTFYVDSDLRGLMDYLIVERGMDKADQSDTGRLMYLLSGNRMQLEVQPPSYTGSAQVSCRGSNKEELATWVRDYFTRGR